MPRKKCSKHDGKHCSHRHGSSGRRSRAAETVYVLDPGQGYGFPFYNQQYMVPGPWGPPQPALPAPSSSEGEPRRRYRRSTHLQRGYPSWAVSDTSDSDPESAHTRYNYARHGRHASDRPRRLPNYWDHGRATSSFESLSDVSFNMDSLVCNVEEKELHSPFKGASRDHYQRKHRACFPVFRRGPAHRRCDPESSEIPVKDVQPSAKETKKEAKKEAKKKKEEKAHAKPVSSLGLERKKLHGDRGESPDSSAAIVSPQPCTEITREILNQNRETQKRIDDIYGMITQLKELVCHGDDFEVKRRICSKAAHEESKRSFLSGGSRALGTKGQSESQSKNTIYHSGSQFSGKRDTERISEENGQRFDAPKTKSELEAEIRKSSLRFCRPENYNEMDEEQRRRCKPSYQASVSEEGRGRSEGGRSRGAEDDEIPDVCRCHLAEELSDCSGTWTTETIEKICPWERCNCADTDR